MRLSGLDNAGPGEVIKIPYFLQKDGKKGISSWLRGTEIPYDVRLFSVIDVWEAMSVNRPYRRAVPEAVILEYMVGSSNNLFDPEVVNAFLGWRKKAGVEFVSKFIYPIERELDTEKWSVL